jgi:uncharacterized RDD family membrane protein YckC
MACRNHPDEVVGLVYCSRCGDEFCSSCVVELQGENYCVDCKREQVRDISSGADATVLDYAGVWKRFVAIFLDGLLTGFATNVINTVLFPGSTVFSPTPAPGPDSTNLPEVLVTMGLAMMISMAIPFLYEGFMLQARGQSLGKMALGVKVVTPEGNDISAGQAWLRTFMKSLLAMPLGLTYWVALFNDEKRTLHDMIANTRVIAWQ